jgi:hypothetical protein
MTGALVGQAVALAFTVGVLIVALAALAARSLFATCIALMAVAAMAATALLALGMETAALAFALVGVGLAPVFIAGAILLGGRSVKAYPGWRVWLTGAACALLIAAIIAPAPGLFSLGAAAPQTLPRGFPALIAVLVFVAALTGVGLLGYGERGLLGKGDRR